MAQVVKIVRVFETANYAVVHWENNGEYQYVACWLPKIRTSDGRWVAPTKLSDGISDVMCHWEQGHYFADMEKAILYAIDKEIEAAEYKIDCLKEYGDRLKEEKKDWAERDWEEDDREYSCDISGICSGRGCPQYYNCQTKNIVYN